MKTLSFLLAATVLFAWHLLPADDYESLQNEFLDERRSLYEERNAIIEAHSDESPEVRRQALADWREENRDRFETVREMGESLSRANEERTFSREAIVERISRLKESEIPENVSEVERDYLEKRRELYVHRLEQEKEYADLSLAERREAMREWRQEASEEFEVLRNLAERLSAESTSIPRSVEISEDPYISEGTSAEEEDFLVKRHELYRERVAIEQEHADESLEERRTALNEWRQERREDFEELRVLADKMSEN